MKGTFSTSVHTASSLINANYVSHLFKYVCNTNISRMSDGSNNSACLRPFSQPGVLSSTCKCSGEGSSEAPQRHKQNINEG